MQKINKKLFRKTNNKKNSTYTLLGEKMNKYLRVFGILSILCFSFYYTEKIALFMQKKDPIYETILSLKDDYEVESVNATINEEYIIPGVIGKEVNVEESFRSMKYLGAFSESNLVFNEIVPEVSISQNKDKIIAQGNKIHQAVALITKDEQIVTYLEEMGIPYAVLTTKETVHYKREHGVKINYDFTNYDEVENLLKKQKENNDLCYITENHKDFCKQKNKTLIEETFILSKSNFPSRYNQVNSGSIVYLEDNLGINYLKVLLDQIRYKGLEIVSISSLISESN
mgnify:CR=1 FL=1